MPELKVSRKSILQFLSEKTPEEDHPRFIIPDYQRPYRWDEEKCETLWDDFYSFYQGMEKQDVYFLGSIVTCRIPDGEGQEVIDGQQRITTILLLLVACYRYITSMDIDEDIRGLKQAIERCLWEVDEYTLRVNQNEIYVTSEVINEDNESLCNILTDSNYADKSQHYSNYQFFQKKLHQLADANPNKLIKFCMAFLTRCVIFPIECSSQDSALTIFSTLNNRGLPLADSDIFKAHIYHSKSTPEEQTLFTTQWKELNSVLDDEKDLSIDDLFRFYSHFIRAKNGDHDREVGMRVFYTQKFDKKDYTEVLKEPITMINLKRLADFWKSVLRREDVFLDIEAKKYLHCLTCYPNEYWKYITSVLILTIYEQKTGEDEAQVQNKIKQVLPAFLKKLTAFLVSRFVFKPTVNSIKDGVFNAYCRVYLGEELQFENPIKKEELQALMQKAARSASKISRSLILLHAYLQDGQGLIPETFQIEHIMPRKWQNTNYNGWSYEDEAKEYLELFGNKSPIESKLNIQAGNAYFGRKKKEYQKSVVQELKAIGEDKSLTDWAKDEILARDQRFTQTIGHFFETQLEHAQ
ncbi:MAG: DUF262 domain-containing HNH endonuclease family protein [Thermoguttaceae bacterium]|nr:DUF262 domain-containing HNH endonuclease family protein [Thermoguttaceae bacterium]